MKLHEHGIAGAKSKKLIRADDRARAWRTGHDVAKAAKSQDWAKAYALVRKLRPRQPTALPGLIDQRG
eukprot:60378-Alexandrium_andersonii.AAC.1